MKRQQTGQILFFTAARIIFYTIHRMVYPFLAVFARGLGVDVQQISWALTVRSGVGGFGPFLGTIADSRGRKAGMLLGLLLFISGLVLVILQPVFWAFVAALALTASGYLVFTPSLQAFLGDSVPYEQRGLAIAVTEMGWSLSFVIGVPLVGLLIARYGWRSPFPVILALSLVYLFFLVRLIPANRPAPGTTAKPWENLRKVFTSRTALAALAVSVCMTTANEVVNLVIGVWMEDRFAFQITALGALAIGIGLTELLGETLVGVLVDRVGKVRAITVGLCLNIGANLVIAWLGSSLAGAFIGVILFYLTYEFTVVSSLPLMTEVLPAARASMMASNTAIVSLSRALGASLAIPLYQLVGLARLIPSGISTNAMAAIGLNLAALLALFLLKKGIEHVR